MADQQDTARHRYVRFTERDSRLSDDAVQEWVEVARDGVVQREIAFDALGNVVHLFPSKKYRQGDYGHFDLAPVEPTGDDSVAPEEFERRWEEARQAAEQLPLPPSDIEEFWRRFVIRVNGPKWLEGFLVLLTAAVLVIVAVAALAVGVLHVGR